MALAPLSDRIDFAFIFGSVARGEDKASSDIDLMVVGAVSLDEILDAARSAEEQLRRPVNPSIYSLQDLREKFHAGNHFLRSLENAEKVFLIGDEDGFREACRIRLVQG
jgi:predicted nucleotidyltransferase